MFVSETDMLEVAPDLVECMIWLTTRPHNLNRPPPDVLAASCSMLFVAPEVRVMSASGILPGMIFLYNTSV